MSSSKRIIETWQISEEDWRKMKPFPGGQSLVWNIPGLNTHGAGMGSRAYLDVGGYEEDELIFIITMKWKPTCDLDKVKVQAAVSVRKAGIKSGGPKNISPSSYLRRQTTNVFGFEFVLSNNYNLEDFLKKHVEDGVISLEIDITVIFDESPISKSEGNVANDNQYKTVFNLYRIFLHRAKHSQESTLS